LCLLLLKLQYLLLPAAFFQQHKQDPAILEIKNMRVSDSYVRCGVGSVLEGLAEHYARESGFGKIHLDTHDNNDGILSFFTPKGFHIEGAEHIYAPSSLEIILCKAL